MYSSLMRTCLDKITLSHFQNDVNNNYPVNPYCLDMGLSLHIPQLAIFLKKGVLSRLLSIIG